MSTGQICHALKQLYIHKSRFDEVAEGLRAVIDAPVIGDGLLPENTMGPILPRRLQEIRDWAKFRL